MAMDQPGLRGQYAPIDHGFIGGQEPLPCAPRLVVVASDAHQAPMAAVESGQLTTTEAVWEKYDLTTSKKAD